MTELGEKLLEIEDAFNTLGWQSDDTFQPVLMVLIGDDLRVKCLNRLRSMWDDGNVDQVMNLLVSALNNEPEAVSIMLFERVEDVRGVALMTEGWCVVGTRDEVVNALDGGRLDGHPDRREHRVVMGLLFEDLDAETPIVWGAQRIKTEGFVPSVERGFGGGVSDLFVEFAEQSRKGLARV